MDYITLLIKSGKNVMYWLDIHSLIHLVFSFKLGSHHPVSYTHLTLPTTAEV